LIVLVCETQAVVQEAMQAYADAVIFKSSLGTGKGDFVQALQTLSEGGCISPRRFASSVRPKRRIQTCRR
jgi:DNA-binding NarL/FixJ family response regulator